MNTTDPAVDGGSFRDREGRVFYYDGAVYRALSETARADWLALSQSDFFRRATAEGRLVRTAEADVSLDDFGERPGTWVATLEHERLPFITYPYEWCFSQLRDAALFHLDLLSDALGDRIMLKDSSAYNIQWIGCRSIHIDIPSFQQWQTGEPWVGYRQFCQHFLYPLLLTSLRGVSTRPWLRGSLDGITPDECNKLLGWRHRFSRGVFSHVYLQSKLLSMTASSTKSLKTELKSTDLGREIIIRNINGLRKVIDRLELKGRTSEWSAYDHTHSYSSGDESVKQEFVTRAASTKRRSMAWDLGCNTGTYSRIISEYADTVVSMDGDELAIERLFQHLKDQGPENILPLVINLADPSPNQGWNGVERKNLLKRGRPELVLCLALIHHLTITANIPLADLVRWFANLGSDLVVEFVRRSDSMVQRLLLNKEDIYHDYHLEEFERLIGTKFRTLDRTETHDGSRVLFFLEPI